MRYGKSYCPARVIWLSSIEALSDCYDPNDWQLKESTHSYEASKYEMELLVGYFETLQETETKSSASVEENGHARLIVNGNEDTSRRPIRHFVVTPGVVVTNFVAASLNYSIVLHYLMQSVFYLVRTMPLHVPST